MIGRLLPSAGTLLLLGVVALMGEAARRAVALDVTRPGPVAPEAEAPVAATDEVGPGAARPTIPPAVDHAMITERPLFAPERRPVEPPPETALDEEDDATAEVEAEPDRVEVEPDPQPAPPEPPVEEPLQLRLHGVMTGTSEDEALVSVPGIEPVWVRLGGEIDGWRIDEIEPHGIVLRRGAERLRLDLHDEARSP